MHHRYLLLEAEAFQPGLIVAPQIAAASANDRVVLQLVEAGGSAIATGVVLAAVKRPIVDAEPPSHEPGRLLR